MHVSRPMQHLQSLQNLPAHFEGDPDLLLRTKISPRLKVVETDSHVFHVDFSKNIRDLNGVNRRKALLMGKNLGIVVFFLFKNVIFFSWLISLLDLIQR